MYDALIVGGGVSGLTLAYELKKLSKSVCLVESENLGGKIATGILEGKVVEEGPEEIVSSKSFLQFVEELGLIDQVVRPRNGRFALLRNEKLYTVPEGIAGGVLRVNAELFHSALSGLFSFRTLVRMMLEPFYKLSVNDDISVKDLFSEIYGRSFVDEFFKPLAGGIYGGDIGLMSSSVYFPYIIDIKKKGKSVIGSFLGKKINFDLISFKKGLGSLVQRIVEKLEGVDIITGKTVTSINNEGDRFSVNVRSKKLESRTVSVMVSPYTAPVFKNIDDHIVKKARLYVKTSRVAVINAVYDKKVESYDKYSGILTYPEVYGVSGVTFFDSKWPINGDSGLYVMKYFVPFESYIDEAKAMNVVEKFSREHFHTEKPFSYRVRIWNEALPVYAVGAGMLTQESEAYMKKGIYFGGSFTNSTGIYSSVMNSKSIAKRIESYLETSTHAGSEPRGSL
ncbi:MAG: protoporphyrinogen oxidase [Nitrososphaeria archaeon]